MQTPHTTDFCYTPGEVAPYIHWIYFFHAWGFPPRFATIASLHGCDGCRAMWLASFPEEERARAAEAMQLHKEALRMLGEWDKTGCRCRARCRLSQATSDGDDLLLDGTRFPLLRQQTVKQEGAPCLCLSDFVMPQASGKQDCAGVFAATVDSEPERLYPDDDYQRLLAQTLADRLAEAATERMHQTVRTTLWGYAPDERLTIAQLHAEEYQGIRPAVGYPSLPDQSVNFLLDDLLCFSTLGITLTENGAMSPHASVSGLMLAHPQARYFAVGHISDEQLRDYAHRRGMEPQEMKKFLAANLSATS